MEVDNAPPVISRLAFAQASIPEGGTATLNGQVADPGTNDTEAVSVTWGDGTSSAATVDQTTRVFTATHVYADNRPGAPTGAYTATAIATDKDGASSPTATAAIEVDNQPPVITNFTASADTIVTGTGLTVTGTFTDVGVHDAPFTASVDWGDGTVAAATVDQAAQSFTASHMYDHPPAPGAIDPARYTIAGSVTDKDGGTGTSALHETVLNPGVTITSITQSATRIDEGGSLSVSGKFRETVAGATDSATVAWGDGSTSAATVVTTGGDGSFTATHVYRDNPASAPTGPFHFVVAVTNTHASSDSAGGQVTVANVAPSVGALVFTPGPAGNGILVVNGSFTDPGVLDTHTAVIAWGDGTSSGATVQERNGSGTFTASHTYATGAPGGTAPATDHITAVVTDKDGGQGFAAGDATVAFGGPHITTLGITPGRVDENGSVVLSGSFTGAAGTYALSVNWGDGSSSAGTVDVAAGRFTATHIYLDNPAGQPVGAFAITATLTNAKQQSDTATTSATVANVAPVVTGLNQGSIREGDQFTLVGSFTDPGTRDTHTTLVAWGDGSSSNAVVDEAAHSFTASHIYANNPAGLASGAVTITATVTDKDGGVGTGTTAVTVANVLPTISQLTLDHGVIDEGSSVILSGVVSDPGLLDPHSVSLAWGDGRFDTIMLSPGVTAFAVAHSYLDNPAGTPTGGHFHITAGVTDDIGAGTGAALELVVNNVAPAIVSLSTNAARQGTVAPGGTVTLSLAFTDPGVIDTHRLLIAWGDSSRQSVVDVPANALQLTVDHVFAATGIFHIGVQVLDKDGGLSPAMLTVAIVGSPSPVILPPLPTPVPMPMPMPVPVPVPLPPKGGLPANPLMPKMATPSMALPVPLPSSSGALLARPITAVAAEPSLPAQMIALVRSGEIALPGPVHRVPPPPPLFFDDDSGTLLTGIPPDLLVDEFGEEWAVLPAPWTNSLNNV